MSEHDLPETSAGPVRDAAWCQEQLEIFRSDPSALDRQRHGPGGYALLKHMAEFSDGLGDRNWAITWLAIAFPHEPTLRNFLIDELRHGKRFDRSAIVYGILANYAADDSAIRQLAAVFHELTTGDAAYLLLDCFHFHPPMGVMHNDHAPSLGISEQEWEDYKFAVTLAPLHLLPNPGLQEVLFEIMRRDPDGPIEVAFQEVLRTWTDKPLWTPRKLAWRVEQRWDGPTRKRQTMMRSIELALQSWKDVLAGADEAEQRRLLQMITTAEHDYRVMASTPPVSMRYPISKVIEPSPDEVAAWARLAEIARELSEKRVALHPKWQRIEDYVQEFDTIDKRRLPGWWIRMFDSDLEHRQARVARRMAQFPDPLAVRRTFETMLLERPAIYPKVRDESDLTFEPVGWRHVAWHVLTASLWEIEEAVAFVYRIVGLGPWDNEARKSKESIDALVRAWPKDERVQGLVADCARREDVRNFIWSDIAELLIKARAGKDISLGRYGNVGETHYR